jgi:hypothetical protein
MMLSLENIFEKCDKPLTNFFTPSIIFETISSWSSSITDEKGGRVLCSNCLRNQKLMENLSKKSQNKDCITVNVTRKQNM